MWQARPHISTGPAPRGTPGTATPTFSRHHSTKHTHLWAEGEPRQRRQQAAKLHDAGRAQQPRAPHAHAVDARRRPERVCKALPALGLAGRGLLRVLLALCVRAQPGQLQGAEQLVQALVGGCGAGGRWPADARAWSKPPRCVARLPRGGVARAPRHTHSATHTHTHTEHTHRAHTHTEHTHTHRAHTQSTHTHIHRAHTQSTHTHTQHNAAHRSTTQHKHTHTHTQSTHTHTTQRSTTQHNTTQHKHNTNTNTTQTQHNTTQRRTTPQKADTIQHDTTRHDTAHTGAQPPEPWPHLQLALRCVRGLPAHQAAQHGGWRACCLRPQGLPASAADAAAAAAAAVASCGGGCLQRLLLHLLAAGRLGRRGGVVVLLIRCCQRGGAAVWCGEQSWRGPQPPSETVTAATGLAVRVCVDAAVRCRCCGARLAPSAEGRCFTPALPLVTAAAPARHQ
jgi:hypothetical protein